MVRLIRISTGSHATELDKAVAQRLGSLMAKWRLTEPKRSWLSPRPFTIGIGERVRSSDLLIHPLGDPWAKWPGPVGLGWGIVPDGDGLLRIPANGPTGGGLDGNVFTVTQDLRLSERPRVLYLGAYRDGSGVSIFFSALKRVLSDQGEGILLGGLEHRDRLAPVVANLGLAQKIVFAPSLSQNQLSGLYRSADLLVYAERDTDLCYQLLDVFAHGLPVLLRDTPDARNIWGYPTLLVEGDDGGAWGEAIQEAILNTRFREILIRRGLEFAESHEKQSVSRVWRRVVEEVSGKTVQISPMRED